MWCLAGLFLGIAVRGTAVAIGLRLAWALENLLRIFGAIVDAVDVVQPLMPGTNATKLAAALGVPVQGQLSAPRVSPMSSAVRPRRWSWSPTW
jgi:hypothetical protein